MKNYDYGIIGNCTSAALISKDCSIDWLCLPFFDSSSVFAKILDDGKGGYFKISAVDMKSVKQSYIPHTPILKTRFETKDGCFEVRDYMPRFLTLEGAFYCPSEIHRDIMLIEGSPEIVIEFCPKPGYAAYEASLHKDDEYIKVKSKNGEYDSYYLYTDISYDKISTSKPFILKRNEFIVLAYHEKLKKITHERIFLEYEKTKAYWMDWGFSKTLPERDKDFALRSLITLKLLMFQRTGAVIAAPTTSLPEIIGKTRNWDYRFCWVRDAAMIVDLYMKTGDMISANRFITFILNRMLLKRDKIGVMYGINGERDLTERTLDHLDGYMSSKPVRVGNAAYSQVQNDVYGELIETLYTYFTQAKQTDIHFNEEIWSAVRSMARKVTEVWDQPDAGIWERRGPLQHHVHSKLMCWVALDRAVKIAEFIGKNKNVKLWQRTADKIKKDILKNGWNKKIGAFTMYYDSNVLDASNLLMFHYGFLEKDDPRMISTVKMSYKNLVKNGFVFRYLDEDDFGIPENSFIVCNFWMINALYLIGEKKKAKDMFDKIVSKANHLGLFSEDLDINSGRLTGNFPQGYSQLSLIQTILLLQTEYDWTDA
ncbi:MAG: glycoside hydrolase family 15 protein [Candidatus Omnitrophica bacterium]|nr:glycoside hydrolase family 15 protein [Candidatus Omnitrophota bacterium]MBU1783831.1 glycoside hydrolase family 15 protein [Candidatus Omnitrophota bacterium]MBU1851832.1 glycoside hydrolase family 15 protein [Candidatus Omnitrophota bacterium]